MSVSQMNVGEMSIGLIVFDQKTLEPHFRAFDVIKLFFALSFDDWPK
jgi:hypothetical protein